MNKRGPILIIEDDPDDQFLISNAFHELNYPNEIIFLRDSIKALEYLTCTDSEPFMVLSDINMPKLSGLELRQTIHMNEALRLKYIPYILLTTSSNPKNVLIAYQLSVQGYFVKPADYDDLINTLARVVEYWMACQLPNHALVTTA